MNRHGVLPECGKKEKKKKQTNLETFSLRIQKYMIYVYYIYYLRKVNP